MARIRDDSGHETEKSVDACFRGVMTNDEAPGDDEGGDKETKDLHDILLRKVQCVHYLDEGSLSTLAHRRGRS